MPLDLQELFATQAAWQRGRARLSWPEKIRMAGLMREAAAALQHRQWLWRPARLAPLPHSPPAALPPPARATLAQDSGTDPFQGCGWSSLLSTERLGTPGWAERM